MGTSQGYSVLWISLGLEETGGKITTIDIALEKVKLAKANIARAGLSHRVTFLQGDAHQLLPTLEGPFDFVFLDADKEGQPDYFKKLHPKKLAAGGIIAVHNAIRMRESMKDYLDMIATHPDFDSVVLPLTMDAGFSGSYRKRKGLSDPRGAARRRKLDFKPRGRARSPTVSWPRRARAPLAGRRRG